MQKTSIRLLFAALALYQLPEYLLIARFGEPYPALMMPSFTGTFADHNGDIRLPNVTCRVHFQGGGMRWVSPYDLLSPAPSSHHGPIMAHMFSPARISAEGQAPDGLKAKLFPGRALSRIVSSQRDLDPETTLWLKNRIRVLFGPKEPDLVSFVWYYDVLNVNHPSPGIVQEPIGVREVRFK